MVSWKDNSCKLQCLPMMFMMLLWSGSIPKPSWHTIRVPLRSAVAVTVAVDVMDVPGITSVTLNWNGGSEITPPWSPGIRDRGMSRPEASHRCESEKIVHVNVTLSPGHGLCTLDCNWASETENEQCCCSENKRLQSLLLAVVKILISVTLY